MDLILSFFATLVTIFLVPILIYGLFSAFLKLKEPDKKLSFMLGILIQKVGTALGFVLLFYMGKDYFVDHWLLYSFVWFAMFGLTEIGQIILSEYSKKEALAGVISELIYFPLAGIVVVSLVH